MSTSIVLASASPRRKELLSHIVERFVVQSADVDESILPNETPEILVERLAKSKAQVIADQYPDSLVIGSDTVVAYEESILGKPLNQQNFLSMMQLLSNKWHQVFTGVCVIHKGELLSQVVVTKVKMTNITQADALAYWLTKEPEDKAGGYAIQGIGGQFVEKIEGSFSAVVGLPLLETKQLIAQFT